MRTFNYSAIREQKWDSEMLGLVAAIYKEAGKQELLAQEACALAASSDVQKDQGYQEVHLHLTRDHLSKHRLQYFRAQ